MPDEKGNTETASEDLPETPLHAHGSGVEEADEHGQEEDAEGNIIEDGEQDASVVPNTGGATAGGPSDDAEGEEDPSNV